MKNYIQSLLITMAVTAAIPASAQTTSAEGQSAAITAEQFISQAALSGMKEVATGKIAKRKGQAQNVKDYGNMMNQDHSKANAELMALAKSKNIKLQSHTELWSQPTASAKNMETNTAKGQQNNSDSSSNNRSSSTMDHNNMKLDSSAVVSTTTESFSASSPADVKTEVQRLEALSGTQFDAAYIQMMLADHKNAIALFERGSQSSDPGVKAFATKHLPTLKAHLQQIQSISDESKNRQQTSPDSSKSDNQ